MHWGKVTKSSLIPDRNSTRSAWSWSPGCWSILTLISVTSTLSWHHYQSSSETQIMLSNSIHPLLSEKSGFSAKIIMPCNVQYPITPNYCTLQCLHLKCAKVAVLLFYFFSCTVLLPWNRWQLPSLSNSIVKWQLPYKYTMATSTPYQCCNSTIRYYFTGRQVKRIIALQYYLLWTTLHVYSKYFQNNYRCPSCKTGASFSL